MKITVLGLGIIGSRAAANLRKNPDNQVTVWNRSPKGAEGEAHSLETAVAEAEVVAIYLKDAPAVREIVARLLDSAPSELTLLNHATVDLPTTQWLAEICTERGWKFLDAPFTGSREAAAAAALVYYAAGDSELIDAIEPLLLQTAKQVIRCGTVGQATVIKLVTNLVSACTVQALAEGLAIAVSQGIKPAAFTAAVASNACSSPLAAMKLPTMASGDFDTHFSLENMLKDSRYALELAAQLETPAIRAVSGRMAELCEDGYAENDFSALAAPYLKP